MTGPGRHWHGMHLPTQQEENKLTGISSDDLAETRTKTLADDIEFIYSGVRSYRAAGLVLPASSWEGDSGQPLAGCSSGKQTSKHQGKGNIRETCWGAQRDEQPLGVRGVVQLGSSLGKLQQDTAFSVSRKYECNFARRCEQRAVFGTSPGNC